MHLQTIIVGTRASKLAVRQTNLVIDQLQRTFPEKTFILKNITTTGDRNLNVPLYRFGDKGVFSNDLQNLLADGEIDIAVHSLKDLPLKPVNGFRIAAYPKREDNRDAFINVDGNPLDDLPAGSTIGTSSVRRAAFIKRYYPQLQTTIIRGPIDQRIAQLNEGTYDGIILAVAGLKRLELSNVITEYLAPKECVPAAGQGALAIECRADDASLIHMLNLINDKETEISTYVERKFVQLLDEDDIAPIGAHATVVRGQLLLFGSVTAIDGSCIITITAADNDKDKVVYKAVKQAVQKGAIPLIEQAKQELL